MAGERGAGRGSWLGLRGMLYRASARSAALFRMISCHKHTQGGVRNDALTGKLAILCNTMYVSLTHTEDGKQNKYVNIYKECSPIIYLFLSF